MLIQKVDTKPFLAVQCQLSYFSNKSLPIKLIKKNSNLTFGSVIIESVNFSNVNMTSLKQKHITKTFLVYTKKRKNRLQTEIYFTSTSQTSQSSGCVIVVTEFSTILYCYVHCVKFLGACFIAEIPQ